MQGKWIEEAAGDPETEARRICGEIQASSEWQREVDYYTDIMRHGG